MKPRRRSVCNNCRRRKLGCDGKRPGCTQCTLTRQNCEGYPSIWKFVSQPSLPGNSEDAKKTAPTGIDFERASDLTHLQSPVVRNVRPRSDNVSMVGTSTSLRNSLDSNILQANRPISDEHINTIIKAYMPGVDGSAINLRSNKNEPQICGAWVEVLPHLSATGDPNSILAKAINALFASVVQRGHGQSTGAPDPIQAYHSSILSLRRAFCIPESQNKAELAATMMCLCLAELMLPEPSTGPEMHARGISALFETYGPTAFRQGDLHKLFAGFLPLVVLEAFRDRKPTFLGSEEWQNVPFSSIPPSAMQRLLCRAAEIPTILHKIDSGYQSSQQLSLSDAQGCLALLIEALARLEDSVKSDGDTYCLSHLRRSFDNQFSFPDVIAANMLTHLWAFKLVCLLEVDKLVNSCPVQILPHQSLPGNVQFRHLHQHVITLSQCICDSMEYLLQDSLALYGPTSTIYPLQIAYKTLKRYPSQQVGISYCEQVVQRLVEKGIRVAPYFVYQDSASA